MLLWVIFAVMTAALVGVVLQPMIRAASTPRGPDDIALSSVYTDQLAEIEADLERGVVGAEEAADMRAEVARRLLAHTDAADETTTTVLEDASGTPRSVTLSVMMAVPVLAISGYLLVGSPLLPSQPQASRVFQDASGAQIAELIRRVETRLASHPDDGKGWDVLAPVYMRTGRHGDAANAWRNATRLLGESPQRVFGFAEAEIFSGNGIVSEVARKALLRGIEIQPDYLPGFFWLAIAKQQDGDLQGARRDLAALLVKTPTGSSLYKTVNDHLRDIDGRLRAATVSDAQGTLPEGETREMIQGMVDGLATRLEADGSDFEGWRRLVRSYVVLKEPEKAKRALAKARTIFNAQSERLVSLRVLARDLRLEP